MPDPIHVRGSLPLVGGAQVELLINAPGLPREELRETLRRLDPKVAFDGTHVRFGGETPGTIEVHEARPGNVEGALSQTWDWPGAPDALGLARAAVAVHESGDAVADRYERLRRMSVVVRALIAHVPTVALHWIPSQRLIDPHAFVQSLAHGSSVTDYAVNVRLFRIPDGEPGETIMDTFGLTPFGLPDLQVHFAGLDPMAVAPVLLHYAEYVFDKGDVLDDEHLIRGVAAHEEWLCQRQESLAPPRRAVVDIHPAEHAVGH